MRNVLVIIFIFLILSGCGVKSIFHRPPAPVESEVIKKADWEVEFRDVYFLASKNGWIIGEKGTILHTTNSGKDWKTQESGTEVRLNKMQFTDKKNGWILGDEGVLLHTIDSGRHWRKQVLMHGSLISLHFLDKHRGWVTGEGGALYHTADGGKTWKFQSSGQGEAIVGIYF